MINVLERSAVGVSCPVIYPADSAVEAGWINSTHLARISKTKMIKAGDEE